MNRKVVLVVDDDTDILDILQLSLSMNGFEVEVESYGENAIPKVLERKPDVIVLDVMLGTTDGRQICERLKANEETREIPVVMFSAHSDVHKVAAECNADRFVSKPFDISFMVDTINSVLD